MTAWAICLSVSARMEILDRVRYHSMSSSVAPLHSCLHRGQLLVAAFCRSNTMLISTRCPGKKHSSQSCDRSISRFVLMSEMTKFPLLISSAPRPYFFKFSARTATSAYQKVLSAIGEKTEQQELLTSDERMNSRWNGLAFPNASIRKTGC